MSSSISSHSPLTIRKHFPGTKFSPTTPYSFSRTTRGVDISPSFSTRLAPIPHTVEMSDDIAPGALRSSVRLHMMTIAEDAGSQISDPETFSPVIRDRGDVANVYRECPPTVKSATRFQHPQESPFSIGILGTNAADLLAMAVETASNSERDTLSVSNTSANSLMIAAQIEKVASNRLPSVDKERASQPVELSLVSTESIAVTKYLS